VRDRFGNPVPGVEVRIDYLLEYVDDGPEPQRTYEVPPPGEAITVGVFNRNNQIVYAYSAGVVQPGPFTFSWDKSTLSGAQAPPGVYRVAYTAGPGVRLSFPVLISGGRAALTDSLGRYAVPDLALPVDFYPIPDYSSDGNTYFGNFRVSSEVVLGFLIDGFEVYRTVQLIRDQVVTFDARLN
jgi:hypothetical protein